MLVCHSLVCYVVPWIFMFWCCIYVLVLYLCFSDVFMFWWSLCFSVVFMFWCCIYVLVLYLCFGVVFMFWCWALFCLCPFFLLFLHFSLYFYTFFLHCDSWSSKTNCSKFSAWDSCYILKDAIKWNGNNWIIKTKSFCILFLNCQINIHTVKLFPFFFLNTVCLTQPI